MPPAITPGQERYLKLLLSKHQTETSRALRGRPITALTKQQASEAIDYVKAATGEAGDNDRKDQPKKPKMNPDRIHRYGTRAFIETKLRELGNSEQAVIDLLIEDVGNPVLYGGKLVFKRNLDRTRVALPLEGAPNPEGLPTQQDRFRGVVREVAAQIRGDAPLPKAAEQPKAEPKAEVKSEPLPNNRRLALDWLRRLQTKIRPHVRERGVAEASMRVSINAAKLFKATGEKTIAFEAIEHSIGLSWPEDTKRELGIKSFDMSRLGTVDPQRVQMPKVEAGEHKLTKTIRTLDAAGIMVALVGPAGCGKSFLPAQLAEQDDVPFGLVPMTAGASTTWLTGAFTLDGFITRPFVDIYENGGRFLFDEMDAADPNMLLLVNNALANGQFQNPANGRIIKKHENFVAMAAMNTLGTGANRRYVGRERLDMATLDRWATGMVEMDYDEGLEKRIFEAILDS